MIDNKLKFLPLFFRTHKKISSLNTIIPLWLATKNNQKYEKVFCELSKKNQNIYHFDPKNILCNDKTCINKINSNLIFRDEHHLSNFGVDLISSHLFKYLEQFKYQ